MKILVTGGAGFIGSHIVDAYLEAGHEVSVVDNLSTGSRKNLNPDARFYETDIRSDKLAVVFDDTAPDVVNHLAAQMDVRQSLEAPQYDADVNIQGTLSLLEQCRRGGVKKFIFASTAGAIYGEPDILPADESCPPRPLSHYGVSKLAGEEYVRLYHRLYSLRYLILRLPNVYGPRQNPHGEAGVCAILASTMIEGRAPTLYGHGEPLRDYVYVEDIARAAVLALDRAQNEVLNLGSGRGTSVRELFDMYQDLLQTDVEPVLSPLRTGEVDQIYTTGDKAASVLGWRPETALREGLRNTAEALGAKLGASP